MFLVSHWINEPWSNPTSGLQVIWESSVSLLFKPVEMELSISCRHLTDKIDHMIPQSDFPWKQILTWSLLCKRFHKQCLVEGSGEKKTRQTKWSCEVGSDDHGWPHQEVLFGLRYPGPIPLSSVVIGMHPSSEHHDLGPSSSQELRQSLRGQLKVDGTPRICDNRFFIEEESAWSMTVPTTEDCCCCY